MKILQVIPTLSAGGAEGFITNLSCDLSSRGHDVSIALLAGVRGERGNVLLDRLKQSGVTVYGESERAPASVRNLLWLRGLFMRLQPDIVQANLYAAEVACLFARLLVWRRRTKYVRRLANTTLYKKWGGKYGYWLRGMLFDHTVACSGAVLDAHRSLVGFWDRGESSVIVNGGFLYPDTGRSASPGQAKQIFGLKENDFLVAHIGSMMRRAGGGLSSAQKAHDVLLKAFAEAFRGCPDTFLALCGDGELRDELELLASELDVAEQVKFLGCLPEPWPLLEAADAFCFPSRYEGMPNVLPEAASCGLPIIASDIDEIRSIKLGESWILCPVDDVYSLADALRTVRSRYCDFVSEAKALVYAANERFSMRACGAMYENCYQKVLMEGRL